MSDMTSCCTTKNTLTMHRSADPEVRINIKCDEDTGQHVVDWAEGDIEH